jgi:glycosyltransferase involved in cell wall biosynthesis
MGNNRNVSDKFWVFHKNNPHRGSLSDNYSRKSQIIKHKVIDLGQALRFCLADGMIRSVVLAKNKHKLTNWFKAGLRIKVKKVDRGKEVFRLSRDNLTYEVSVESKITLNDYRRITLPSDWELLKKFASSLAGKTIVFINPTFEGGGVAMLRPPLVHMLKLLGVNAHWYVMAKMKNPDDPSPFIFTKQMHNILQRRTPPDVRITNEGKALHKKWSQENAVVLTAQNNIKKANIIVIDDPQPAGLKRYIDSVNPNVKWVWRNHIDTDGKLMSNLSTPQGEVASYLLDECGMRNVDAVITHPVAAFVYPDMTDKTYFAPATIDPFDDLNRHLNDQEVKDGIDFINNEINQKNLDFLSKNREVDLQNTINPNKRRIVLIARFDESKGMDKAMEIGVRVRRKMRHDGLSENNLPQVIIVGNGSVDDPSGVTLYEEVLRIRRENYPDEKPDIVVMRLKHNYAAINALMYSNPREDIDKTSEIVAMQTSEAEGCETRISDWIKHGVPVLVSNRGGMSLQIVEGKSGFVIDYDKPDYDLERGSSFIYDLMTNYDRYEQFTSTTLVMAEKYNNREFSTAANVTRLTRVFDSVLTGKKANKVWKISELVEYYPD